MSFEIIHTVTGTINNRLFRIYGVEELFLTPPMDSINNGNILQCLLECSSKTRYTSTGYDIINQTCYLVT